MTDFMVWCSGVMSGMGLICLLSISSLLGAIFGGLGFLIIVLNYSMKNEVAE